jgi:4-amino-4-deoxy-L-arabinose transferase-like glycosyltransferase
VFFFYPSAGQSIYAARLLMGHYLSVQAPAPESASATKMPSNSLTFDTTADKPGAMIEDNDRYYIRWSLLLIFLCTVARIFYAQWFLLSPDETNYWQWSRHLAWGYHDQTPMIAWAIRLGTMLCGHTELGVRLPSIMAMAVGSIYMMLFARHWFGARIAWQTTLLGQAIFIFNVGAVLATADGLQGAAWAATSYHVARGFENNQWRQWLWGGVWFGMGLLSKYTMVLFLPIVFLFGLLSSSKRHRLASVRPYLGCAVGLILFAPVVAWNFANNWNSFRHVAYLGGANTGFELHLNYFGDYLGSQVGLLTPLVFILIGASWLWVLRRWPLADKWVYTYLFFTSFPVIAGFGALSLHTRIYGNWPCAGYLTATILCAALWAYDAKTDNTRAKKKTRMIWRWTVGSAWGLTLLVLGHVLFPILPIPTNVDRIEQELRGWDQLGVKVGDAMAELAPTNSTFVFGLNYQMASELAFYVPGQPHTVSINRWQRPNVYDYWWEDQDLMGQDAIGVLSSSKDKDKLLQVFERVDPPISVFKLYPRKTGKGDTQSAKPMKRYYIYRCYGFKGGLRWIPKSQDDVRSRS